VTKYRKPIIALHWLSAILIIVMMLSGLVGSKIAQDSLLRLNLIKIHGTIGLVVLLLTALRLFFYFTSEHPAPLEMPEWRKQAFAWNHRLIYIVIVALLLTGVGMLLSSGIGLATTNITADKIVDSLPRTIHGILPKFFLFLFVMHVVGVLHYQFTKGKTLSRMCARTKQGQEC